MTIRLLQEKSCPNDATIAGKELSNDVAIADRKLSKRYCYCRQSCQTMLSLQAKSCPNDDTIAYRQRAVHTMFLLQAKIC